MPASVNATLGSRGLPKGGRPKHVSTVSSKGGPARTLTYHGTPVSRTGISPSKAPRAAQRVQKALKRVRKAYAAPPKFSSLEPDQAKVLSTVLKQGEKMGASKREKLAAVETGLVESNLRNLGYGDADSAGWRQERASLYPTGRKGPQNVKASARRFFSEIKTEGAGAPTPGLAAQGAQGSAFPERYDQREGEARRLLREANTPAKKPKAKDLKTLDKAGVEPGQGTHPAKPVPQKLITRFKAAKKAAKGIEREQMPYQWGGGHVEGKIPRGQPLDCSAAVRAVLQRAGYDPPPMVASQFKSYGKPGPGALTIYAKDDHVLMRIGNKFFGTSGSNPGGGAGWIEKEDISPGYLDAFTARHLPGLGKKTAASLGVEIAKAGGASASAAAAVSGGGTSTAPSGGRPGGKGPTRKQKLRRVQTAYSASDSTSDASLSDLERRYGSPGV